MKNFYEKHPLLVILTVAFALRTTAAFYNYTPTAEDDYANVIEPALQLYQTGAPIVTEAYRLPLLPKIFYAFIAPLKILHITDTTFLASWGFFCLGLFSLAGVWAFYRLGTQIGMAKTAGWLYAAHFILPFFSTRAFQESLTLTTVPVALYFLLKDNARWRDFCVGGFFIGLTVIFRFQAAIFAALFFIFFTIRLLRRKMTLRQIGGYALGGFFAVLLLVALDRFEGRAALGTPLEYLRINYAGNVAEANYGGAPWHTYITLLAVVFIPPFSFVLLYPLVVGLRTQLLLATHLVVFVALHSLIANKLERFMLPVLPFFFLLSLHGLKFSLQHKIVRIAWRGFVAVNILILLPITLSRSQLNTIDAARYLAKTEQPLALYRIDLWRQAYMTFAKPTPPNFSDSAALVAYARSSNASGIYILSLGRFSEVETKLFEKNGTFCKLERRFEPSWQEKLVIRANPQFNARRDTTYLYRCISSPTG
ncbi:MAG: hypothetical protein JSR44_06790 [Spirochaetes bacterium]|nr:hypothetical protein [Spirochaetota bacterium]